MYIIYIYIYIYAQTLIVVNLIVVNIFGFFLITCIICLFWGEPRVVSDTPGYGAAVSGTVQPKISRLEAKQLIFRILFVLKQKLTTMAFGHNSFIYGGNLPKLGANDSYRPPELFKPSRDLILRE